MEYATVELQGMEDVLACLDTKGSGVISVSRLLFLYDIFNSSDIELLRMSVKSVSG